MTGPARGNKKPGRGRVFLDRLREEELEARDEE